MIIWSSELSEPVRRFDLSIFLHDHTGTALLPAKEKQVFKHKTLGTQGNRTKKRHNYVANLLIVGPIPNSKYPRFSRISSRILWNFYLPVTSALHISGEHIKSSTGRRTPSRNSIPAPAAGKPAVPHPHLESLATSVNPLFFKIE
jgi:hypothetical protein